MIRPKLNHKGFSTVEGALLLVIVLLIGFIGYFVYHANKNATDTINASSKISQSSAPKRTKKATDSSQYFIIKEWGVRAKNTTGITPLYSIENDGHEVWAHLSSQELVAADPTCSVESQAAGIITRAQADDHLYTDAGDDTGQTISQAIAAGTLKNYKKVGSYYYWYERSHAACGSTDEAVAVQAKTETAMQTLVMSLEVKPLEANVANQ